MFLGSTCFSEVADHRIQDMGLAASTHTDQRYDLACVQRNFDVSAITPARSFSWESAMSFLNISFCICPPWRFFISTFLTYVKGKLLAETLCNPSFAFILYRFPHWRAFVFCIQFVSALAYPACLAETRIMLPGIFSGKALLVNTYRILLQRKHLPTALDILPLSTNPYLDVFILQLPAGRFWGQGCCSRYFFCP